MSGTRLLVVLLGGVSSLAWAAAAQGADLLLSPIPIAQEEYPLTAVSAVNGKWEFHAGAMSPGNATFRAAGSLSLPVGDRFGLQGDVMASLSSTGLTYGGALHAFTRDPSSYLAGVTAGVVVAPGARLGALGLEGELYLDQVSLEGWVGFAAIDYVDPLTPDATGLFAIGDIAYYPTEDWRVALGASSILGDNALRLSTEYLFRDLGAPLSLTADARAHASGAYSFTVGLKGYIGGNDDQKTLINRHRQDDPPNRALDLFSAASNVLGKTTTAPAPVDPEAACIAEHQQEIIDSEGACTTDGEWVLFSQT